MDRCTFWLAICLLSASSFAQDRSQHRTIDSIEIVIEDVFEDGGSTPDFWGYRFANDLHIKTRESVIRRELLFAEGEPVNDEALAQTERNLRALPFLRRASVETIPVDEGRVRVLVVASDSWSTQPEVRLAKVGNEWVWALGASERNLFGRGKQLRVLRDSNLDRDQTLLWYRDPRLLGSRIATDLLAANASDGHHAAVSVERPFFAIDTLWSYRLVLEDFERLDPLYENGERIDELRHLRRWGQVGLSRAVRRTGVSAVRLHLGYEYSDDDIDDSRDVRTFGIVRVGVSAVRHDYLELTHVNRFERAEDINLGNEASAFIGVSTPALGGEDQTSYFFFLAGRRGFRLSESGFLLASASWQARRRNDRLENNFSRFRLDIVQKLSLRKLILAKAVLRYGRHMDPEIQIRLGAESGLRGYPVRQFNGDRAFLASVEGRWFIADDVGKLASVGVAAFADWGFAWPAERPMAFSDLRSNVGVSLLLGSNRVSASRPGVRIDVAYALEPLPGRGPWLISAGSQIGF